ncbi:MAG TPA: Hint domain-containing protein [Archangium sp.]|uniref:Hint domain-containing protein n=1 Tax=Archangium sp. TaxID=1872627 RepID=UPI002E33F213|nr:Hint domain-containing protein [Archangium sp.]HEX5746673.1 Hint domain-containing protein [Archangium sp.]
MRKLTLFLAALIPALASAQDVTSRCAITNDWLTVDVDAIGRNAWARKCGYISTSMESFLNTDRLYITFLDASGGIYKAPVRDSYACITGLQKLGYCYTGCYTPEQRLSFEGRYIGVQEAAEQKVANVTALTPASSQSLLSYGEQAIKFYVAGDTEESIYVLKTADGRRLEVTSTHPMVRGTGEVVKAVDLKVGDTLLGGDGKEVALVEVSTFLFKGKVWNVLPFSQEKMENIFDAEGLLSGSIRFQNQWGDEAYRLSLRDELEAGAR